MYFVWDFSRHFKLKNTFLCKVRSSFGFKEDTAPTTCNLETMNLDILWK